MVVEAGVCEVTPAGRPLSCKLTVPRKPLSKPLLVVVSTCRIVLLQPGAPLVPMAVFGWVSPPVQLLVLSQVGRPPRTRYAAPSAPTAAAISKSPVAARADCSWPVSSTPTAAATTRSTARDRRGQRVRVAAASL